MSTECAKEANVRRLIESLGERTIAPAELAELQDAAPPRSGSPSPVSRFFLHRSAAALDARGGPHEFAPGRSCVGRRPGG